VRACSSWEVGGSHLESSSAERVRAVSASRRAPPGVLRAAAPLNGHPKTPGAQLTKTPRAATPATVRPPHPRIACTAQVGQCIELLETSETVLREEIGHIEQSLPRRPCLRPRS
jgi:hypothetical protein